MCQPVNGGFAIKLMVGLSTLSGRASGRKTTRSHKPIKASTSKTPSAATPRIMIRIIFPKPSQVFHHGHNRR
ncbi:hypothetical protein [Iodidimonas gelatinilytica]|uniref:hypothetical protein n=1 Tax=Iodidimonas gelatinilytica TaxID=1236966 RepID=UPI001230545F|nr:hypothetical protein [Iodidimonas gelatinilytica]